MEITRKELYELIWKEPVTKVAEKLGFHAPLLRKYCHQLNIPTPSSGYWSKLKFGKPVEIPALPEYIDEVPSIDSFQEEKKKRQNAVEQGKEQSQEILNEKDSVNITNNQSEDVPVKKEDAQEDKIYEIEEIADPRQKIQIELKKMDQSLFTVPEMLYAKHPLIIDTKEYFRGEKNNKYLDKNPYKSKIKAPLNISVQSDSLDRALRIYTTIIHLLQLRGHQIVAEDRWHTYAIVNEEQIPLQLSEKNKQIANTESNYPKYLTVPSGKLKFEIPRSSYFRLNPVCVEDTTNMKIEEKILNIIAKIEYEAISIKEEKEKMERLRHQQEEERKRRELEEQKKREIEEKRKNELKELNMAFFSAECYSLANILRSYLERYKSFLTEKEIIDEEAEEKLCWLRGKIDWLDPFIEYDDELLTENDKENLICPKSDEIPRRTTWQSFSSMYPEFTFWNNPFRKRR